MRFLLSNVAGLARIVAAASRLRSPARVPTRWTWLHAPPGSGAAAPPPRDVLTSGLGSLPRQPVGVLSPTLGSLGQEHSGQKPRRGPRKRSCDLRAVAARRKERTKRTGMVGQGSLCRVGGG